VLKAAFADVVRRLDGLDAHRKAELGDHEQRKAALLEFARTLGPTPDYGTDGQWEVAKLDGTHAIATLDSGYQAVNGLEVYTVP
jgi:hypothetical protein